MTLVTYIAIPTVLIPKRGRSELRDKVYVSTRGKERQFCTLMYIKFERRTNVTYHRLFSLSSYLVSQLSKNKFL